ncbi:YycH family regulatory protein [Niallia oryzisoli]|uniref:YycH family regulatory protein n=1 Tax=Niallia oryzisoli TaxID=1737571 RepID=UPI0037367A5C
MTYESIKSIILTILVGASLLLTWSLWTYQPNYEELENGETVQEVSFSPKKALKDIVKPDQILYHSEDGFHGTFREEEIEKVINAISQWHMTGFENLALEGSNVYSLIDNQEAVEILYPSEIAINLYKNVLGIKEKDIPNFHFNQIVIPLNIEQREHGVIYFVSNEEKRVYRSMIPFSLISEFKGHYFEAAKAYSKYFPYTTTSGRRIYLPEGETEMLSYQHLSSELDSDKFKDALFNDPSLVQKNYTATGVEYTDASSLMRVNTDINTISYIDPSELANQELDTNNLLKRSIDFVNGHGGWTDNYRFVGMDKEQHMVHFRLYGQDGYPIFSENTAIAKIRLIWGNTDINRYIRSNFSLGLLTSTSPRKLDSGAVVLEKIQKINQFNPNLLENIKIGYDMKMNDQSLLIQLEPSWYYLYNGVWKQLKTSEYGGEVHGLE